MSRKRFTPEQIIHKLREAEVELAKNKATVRVRERLVSLIAPATDCPKLMAYTLRPLYSPFDFGPQHWRH